MRHYHWAVAAVVVSAGLAAADGETVGVTGSEVRYPTRTQVTIGYRPVQLVLTGTAMRKSHGLDVYAIGSYVQEGAKVKTAEQLVAADGVKQLHMVLAPRLD